MRDDLPTRGRTAPSWTRPITERLTPAIKALVIAESLVFVFYLFAKEAQPFIREHLVLGPGFWRGEVWQPITALVVHVEVIGLLFSVVGLWWVGATVERLAGTAATVQMFFIAGVLGNVTSAAAGLALGVPAVAAGSGLAVIALYMAFGRIMGTTEVSVFGGLFVRARSLVFAIVGVSLLITAANQQWDVIPGLFVACGVGWAMAPGGLAVLFSGLRVRRARRHVSVIQGGRRDKPRYLN